MALRVVYYEASHDHASRRNSLEFHRFPIIAGQRKDTRRLPTQLPGLLACGDPDAPLLVAAGEQQQYGLGPSDGGPATSTGHSASLVVRVRRGGTAGTAGRTSPASGTPSVGPISCAAKLHTHRSVRTGTSAGRR